MISNVLRRMLKGLLLGASAGLRLWAQDPAAAPIAGRDLARTVGLSAPVALHDLTRGTRIGAADLRADSGVQADRFIGWEVRRLIKAGELVRAPAVEPPALVTANSAVTIEATVAGVRVTRGATALGRGAMGDRVTVRLDQQRIVAATVIGPATVRIDHQRPLAGIVTLPASTRLAQGTDR